MRFSLTPSDATPLDGFLVFTESDHAFGFQPGSPMVLRELIGNAGVTSLSIETLQIEVAVASRVVLFVWGLHPRARWQTGTLERPSARPGLLRLEDPVRLEAGASGVSIELESGVTWRTTYDPGTGWLRVAQAGDTKVGDRILIATGTVIDVLDGKINAVWLQPIFD